MLKISRNGRFHRYARGYSDAALEICESEGKGLHFNGQGLPVWNDKTDTIYGYHGRLGLMMSHKKSEDKPVKVKRDDFPIMCPEQRFKLPDGTHIVIAACDSLKTANYKSNGAPLMLATVGGNRFTYTSGLDE